MWGILTFAENSPGADFLDLHGVRSKEKKWNKEQNLLSQEALYLMQHRLLLFFFSIAVTLGHFLPNKTNLMRLRKRLMMHEKSDHAFATLHLTKTAPLRSFGFEIHEAPRLLTRRQLHITLCTVYLPPSSALKVDLLRLPEAIFSI